MNEIFFLYYIQKQYIYYHLQIFRIHFIFKSIQYQIIQRYYPRREIKVIKVDKRDYAYWKKKHSTPSPVRGVRTPPGVGTYNHFPLSYDTFGKIQAQQIENQKSDKNNNKINITPIQKQGEKFVHFGFGVSQREIDAQFSKSKARFLPRPGPVIQYTKKIIIETGNYNLILDWKEKKEKEQDDTKQSPSSKKSNYLKYISKGVEKSMYYDSSPNLI